jgi:hypothetical protein
MMMTDELICPECGKDYFVCEHAFSTGDYFDLIYEARQWAKYYKARTRYFYARGLILSHQADEFMDEWDKLCKENAELRRKLEVATQAIYNAIDDSVNYPLDVIISDLRLELAKIKRDTPSPSEDGCQ